MTEPTPRLVGKPNKRHPRTKAAGKTTPALNNDQFEPTRFQHESKLEFERLIIPLSAISTGALTMLAAPELLNASSATDWLKVGFVGLAAGFVSYVVNDKAINAGAELSAKGFKLAALASVVPIVLVGMSAAIFSYSGLVLGEVDDLNRQEHAQALRGYVADVNAHVVQSVQLKPTIDAAASDINRGLACEVTEGCLSSGTGGKGSVYRTVYPFATRANEISVQLESIEKVRRDELARANVLIGQYETLLSDSQLTLEERERLLARKSAEVKDRVESLRQTLPASFFASYANELQSGISLPDKPEAMRNVNSMLKRNGLSIENALEVLKPDRSVSPAFPAKSGVSEAIERLEHFWPIAMLTFAVELTIPVVMWVFAFLGLLWTRFSIESTGRAPTSATKR
jgi:hypothetical protein